MTQPPLIPDRVCDSCGRAAGPDDFFCRGCNERLANPQGFVDVERMRPPKQRPRPGQVVNVVIGVLVVVAVVVGAVVAYVMLDPFSDPTPPRDVGREYVEAIRDGDCAAADDLRTEPDDTCADAVAALDELPITDIKVEDELVIDDTATVTIRCTFAGAIYRTIYLQLELDDDRWVIADGRFDDPQPVP